MVQVVKLPRFEKMLKIILNWKRYFLTETPYFIPGHIIECLTQNGHFW